MFRWHAPGDPAPAARGRVSFMRTLITAVPALALSGCVTMGSVQRAGTLGKGNFEFGVEPGFWGGLVTSRDLGVGNLYLPSVNFSGRYGVSDRFDIGGRIGGDLMLMAKILLTDPESTTLAMSLAPSI